MGGKHVLGRRAGWWQPWRVAARGQGSAAAALAGSGEAGGAGGRPGRPNGGCMAVAWEMLRHGTLCATAMLHRGSDPQVGTQDF